MRRLRRSRGVSCRIPIRSVAGSGVVPETETAFNARFTRWETTRASWVPYWLFRALPQREAKAKQQATLIRRHCFQRLAARLVDCPERIERREVQQLAGSIGRPDQGHFAAVLLGQHVAAKQEG